MQKRMGRVIFQSFNYGFLIVLSFIMLYPFWYVLVGSIVPYTYYSTHPILLWPQELSIEPYKTLLSTQTIPNAYKVTIFATVVGTTFNLVLTSMAAYVLSIRKLPGRNILFAFVLFTMLFNGGLVPTYLMYSLYGLIDNVWVYIIPSLINVFFMVVLKNSFMEVPGEIKEAAIIDGCNDMQILWCVILPVSLPILATITLFYAVNHWNELFIAIFFIQDRNKYTLQAALYNMITRVSASSGAMQGTMNSLNIIQVRLAAIILAVAPILFVYPFLQKYFVKGLVMGSIKG